MAYCIGLAKNSRLVEKIGWELSDAQAEAERKRRPARRFAEFPYATLTSWSRRRRVVAKAEHLPGKANPRFVVTSLPNTFSARTVYERVYCPRGNMENVIKEQQLDLFSDRTSATRFAANQLRLLFSAFASILFDALRRALQGTRLGRATAGTLRLKLLKIGARVSVSMRRLKVAYGLRPPFRRRLRPGPRTTPGVTTQPHPFPAHVCRTPPGTGAPHRLEPAARTARLPVPPRCRPPLQTLHPLPEPLRSRQTARRNPQPCLRTLLAATCEKSGLDGHPEPGCERSWLSCDPLFEIHGLSALL